MNHHRAGRLLSAYVDSELTAAETRAVQEHLLDCAACRDAYENLRAARDLLGGLPPAEPPAEFWAAVRGPVMRGAAAAGALGGWAGRLRAAWASVARFPWPGIAGRRPGLVLAGALVALALAALPLVKGTVDRLHATEIGVDLYVHDHALQMGTAPLVDRAYVGLVAGDAELVLAGNAPRPIGDDVR
ncbi:MAG TPA: zf-HC2 domain-containing protein [bacterium]|nr:zf-HC2 domain-containing protein [bacterium]